MQPSEFLVSTLLFLLFRVSQAFRHYNRYLSISNPFSLLFSVPISAIFTLSLFYLISPLNPFHFLFSSLLFHVPLFLSPFVPPSIKVPISKHSIALHMTVTSSVSCLVNASSLPTKTAICWAEMTH